MELSLVCRTSPSVARGDLSRPAKVPSFFGPCLRAISSARSPIVLFASNMESGESRSTKGMMSVTLRPARTTSLNLDGRRLPNISSRAASLPMGLLPSRCCSSRAPSHGCTLPVNMISLIARDSFPSRLPCEEGESQ
eukprot:scaffold130998_cov60-Phaeocystis_antarctica.AAC.5